MADDTNAGSILVVDDTPANLGLLSNILTKEGYRVRPAPNGRLALRASQNDPPDLILLDINMPEMDGFEVCRRLKDDPRLTSIPVLFISALTETEDKVKAFNAGGLDYITKPFQAEEVLARVDTHLKSRRYQLELNRKSESLQKALDELKATQSQLVQSEKMASLGVLTAGIAHEINNPINFIKTSAHALSRDMEDIQRLLTAFEACSRDCPDTAIRERIAGLKADIDYDALTGELTGLVDNINLGAERTADIVKSLRIYSRPDEKKMSATHLEELIETALVLLQNRYKKKIDIKKTYGALPAVHGHAGRLMQVFNNVIDNAIDAVLGGVEKGDPSIDIITAAETVEGTSFAVIRIKDNGTGIRQEDLDKVFDPFFSTKEVGQGVGLGMSLSHGIIRDHQGHIDITSRVGAGTTVSIFLPLDSEQNDGQR